MALTFISTISSASEKALWFHENMFMMDRFYTKSTVLFLNTKAWLYKSSKIIFPVIQNLKAKNDKRNWRNLCKEYYGSSLFPNYWIFTRIYRFFSTTISAINAFYRIDVLAIVFCHRWNSARNKNPNCENVRSNVLLYFLRHFKMSKLKISKKTPLKEQLFNSYIVSWIVTKIGQQIDQVSCWMT